MGESVAVGSSVPLGVPVAVSAGVGVYGGVAEALGTSVMLGVGTGPSSQRTSAGRSAAVSVPSLFASAALHALPSKGAAATAARSAVGLSRPSQSASPPSICPAWRGIGTQSCRSAARSSRPVVMRLFTIAAAAPCWVVGWGVATTCPGLSCEICHVPTLPADATPATDTRQAVLGQERPSGCRMRQHGILLHVSR